MKTKLNLKKFTLAFLTLAQFACSSSSDNKGTVPVTPQGALTISPATTSVAISTQATFSATGGTPPYYFFSASGNGRIDKLTGVYTAPGNTETDQIVVVDALNAYSYATVSVTPASSVATCAAGSALAINPSSITLAYGGGYTFQACGGTAPYKFYRTQGNGTIDVGTGAYSAPYNEETDQVEVVDSANATAIATIKVTNNGGAAVTGNLIKIYRAISYNIGDHLYSVTENEGAGYGYSDEGVAFRVFSDGSVSGTQALMRCRTTSFPQRHFLSLDPGCEGKIVENVLGYVYSSQSGNATQLFRFTSQNNHDSLATTDYNEGLSAGYKTPISLGYAF